MAGQLGVVVREVQAGSFAGCLVSRLYTVVFLLACVWGLKGLASTRGALRRRNLLLRFCLGVSLLLLSLNLPWLQTIRPFVDYRAAGGGQLGSHSGVLPRGCACLCGFATVADSGIWLL